jgi:hypothetical protein
MAQLDKFNPWQFMSGQGNQNRPEAFGQMVAQASPYPIGQEPPPMTPMPGLSNPGTPPGLMDFLNPANAPVPEMPTSAPMSRMTPEQQQAIDEELFKQAQVAEEADEMPEVTPEQLADPYYSASQALQQGNADLAAAMKVGEQNYAEAQMAQQGEVDKLKEAMARYQSADQPFDYRPLAAFVDAQFGGGGVYSKLAADMAPESANDRLKNVAGLQKAIIDAQGGLTKAQLEAMKNKLTQMGYMSEREAKLEMEKLKAKQAERSGASRRAAVQEDNLRAKAADLFDKDPLIRRIRTQHQQIAIDLHTLDAPILTPQVLREIEAGLARAISGGGAVVAEVQIRKQEFQSAYQELVNLKQQITNNPQDINSPAVRKQLKVTLERLKEAYEINMANQANTLRQGRDKVYLNNTTAKQVMDDKVKAYQPGGEAYKYTLPAHDVLQKDLEIKHGGEPSSVAPSELKNAAAEELKRRRGQ